MGVTDLVKRLTGKEGKEGKAKRVGEPDSSPRTPAPPSDEDTVEMNPVPRADEPGV